MWDHIRTSHPDLDNLDSLRDFKFSILRKHRDPLTRQLEEAVRIFKGLDSDRHTDNKGTEVQIQCMNRKEEAFAPQARFDKDRHTTV